MPAIGAQKFVSGELENLRRTGGSGRQNKSGPRGSRTLLMSQRFVHLHNHTEFSLLDGANRIPAMVGRAKELGMDSLAITDHGVMFGVMEFYWACKEAGIKPLIGMEAYVAPNGHKKRSGREDNDRAHLLLLAKNLEGYRNLCKLATIAALEGFYSKPRIDHELLRQYGAGLIGTSTCLSSEICRALLREDYVQANHIAGMYKEIFGEGNYFIELQDHRLAEQERIRPQLLRLSKELDIPLVATNDAHYLCKTDHDSHELLLCIQTNDVLSNSKRMKFNTREFYLKSQEEMEALFADVPEAIGNTGYVADMCEVELAANRAGMPLPELPEGETPGSYLRKVATESLPRRVQECDEAAWERLKFELDVIESTGFESYFLLVREFANYAREQGIHYGVRGSAAGSLVSYAIGITEVDPLHYDLTFERFLNPERVSMPDIDMDFEDARREEMIQYVTGKYGSERVAQIVTFGTMGAKAAIRDTSRVLGKPPQEADRICKCIPNTPGITLEKALEEIAEFKQLVASDPEVREIVDKAKSVEGRVRHCGVHAAGLVISGEPLVEYVPLYRGNEGQPITAFEMGVLEKMGLLKMDFLGLSNLTVLAQTVRIVAETRGEHLDIGSIPLDDEATFEMLGRGDTTGVFQLESPGMRRHIQELKPRNVKELSAMVALFRPGPIKHIPEYIDAKYGRKKPEFLDDRMQPILEETYGVIVYQDQVLKSVRAVAGFTLGKADLLRKAMSKKDKSALDALLEDFLKGCAANGVEQRVAKKIWTRLEPFAGYAFNKAHAVCYAILAYQTAYLKAHYPVEYMAALLGAYMEKEDRVITLIDECRRQRIPVLQPSINRSGISFGVEGSAIRFGLAAIKGVGTGMVSSLIEEREANGPFGHLYEVAERLKPMGATKPVLEALIKAGALDEFGQNRLTLLGYVDGALSFADSANRDRNAGQVSLFGEGEQVADVVHYPELPEAEPPDRAQLTSMEKEVLGVYVSDHPLRGYERLLPQMSTHRCGAITELDDGTPVRMAGVVSNVRTLVTKRTGEKMASFRLEDFSGQVGVIVFAKTFAKLGDQVENDTVVQVEGAVMHRERRNGGEKDIEVRLDQLQRLDPPLDLDLASPDSMAGTVVIQISRATEADLKRLSKLLADHPGDYGLRLDVLVGKQVVPIFPALTVDPQDGLLRRIPKAVPGAEVTVMSADESKALAHRT